MSVTGGTTQATDYCLQRPRLAVRHHGRATGEQWTRTYNLLGQVTGRPTPNAGTTTHDLRRRRQPDSSTTDADGNTITYTYDPLSRKTGEYDGTVARPPRRSPPGSTTTPTTPSPG